MVSLYCQTTQHFSLVTNHQPAQKSDPAELLTETEFWGKSNPLSTKCYHPQRGGNNRWQKTEVCSFTSNWDITQAPAGSVKREQEAQVFLWSQPCQVATGRSHPEVYSEDLIQRISPGSSRIRRGRHCSTSREERRQRGDRTICC